MPIFASFDNGEGHFFRLQDFSTDKQKRSGEIFAKDESVLKEYFRKWVIKHHKRIQKLFMLGLFAFISMGCVQTTPPSNKRKGTTVSSGGSNGGETPNPPNFPKTLNYFQNGSSSSTGNFPLPYDFNDSFYLRGEEVDDFIKDNNKTSAQCLISVFESSSTNQILVTAATPKSFFNFATNVQEYYYLLEPNSENTNKSFCQTPGILATLNNLHPGKNITFAISKVCPNCAFSDLLSTPETLFSQHGHTLQNHIDLNNLRLKLLTTGANPDPGASSCSSTPQCQAKGFDCCSFGQCIKDRQLKSDADTSSDEYAQALVDIENNPNAIYGYPQFYHLCSTVVPPSNTPAPRPDPDLQARQRFLELERLYQCTTPQEGEMALCTVSYKNVQQASTNEFSTEADDRNFNTTYTGTNALPQHSVYKVIYAGETLFENNQIVTGVTIGPGGNGTGNDNVNDKQVINITHSPAPSAPDDDLILTYKIDGSCEKITSTLAKCYKQYIQGQNLSRVNDHFPASNAFQLPFYAALNRTIKVDVDGAVKLAGTHWNLIQTTPARVEFIGSNLQVYDTQIINISFYVDLTNYPNLMLKKQSSLERIKDICECVDTKCRLKPRRDDNTNQIVDYICQYPQPNLPDPPLQQTVLLDSKSVPHRYYDVAGVYQDKLSSTTPAQEGNEFKYTNSDLLRPNNVNQYIGFNEIYGSFHPLNTSAQPAKEVQVKKGRTYDIYTNQGTFSTCFFCGTDYYSHLIRTFPENFLHKGGGYRPDQASSQPFTSSTYRKDDLLFGRACWVPTTMIPWTHNAESDRQQQRLKRLTAQHFLFANGYQRDWYGFDYGSVIGSWDGVSWFSIGNQRRIQAKSNKLFLAINAYFGDLTQRTSFSITVQDAPNVPSSGPLVTNNFESDGAECQKHHLCDTDRDCIANLGWEYSCESIATLTSKWPSFDPNGLEIPGVEKTVNLRSEFGATSNGVKRCIYRGRGSLCQDPYDPADPNTSYSGTTKRAFHHCSYNNYCQAFIEGIPVPLFNTKISRYGKSVKQQNASSAVQEDNLDTFGLHIRSLGRPYSWRGTDPIPTSAQASFSNNNVSAICLPGRDPNDDTLQETNTNKPIAAFLGDKVNGIGMTPEGAGTAEYLSSCSILDSDGDYLYKDTSISTLLSDSTIQNLAANQAIATNALSIFESPQMTGNEIVKNFEGSQIEEIYLQENRCLRTPGSVCFSSMDCAPNSYIASKVAHVNVDDTTVTAILNKYDIQFWQEELICSQALQPGEEDFDLKNNRCCRETEQHLTIGTATNTSGTLDFNTSNIPGLGSIALNDRGRYHRMSTVWDLMSGSQAASYPALEVAANDSCVSRVDICTRGRTTDFQHNTFATIADRTCCSGHWIREFNREENGGGHQWSPDKLQTIPKESLRCLNWQTCSTTADSCGGEASQGYFSCEHTDDPDDPTCLMRATSLNQAEPHFNFLATLELTGIAGVKVKTKDWPDIHCQVSPVDQSATASASTDVPLPNLISDADVEPSEYDDHILPDNRYYSAGDRENFNSDNLKMVFDPDRVTCCLPAGTQVPANTNPNRCCTGFINQQNRRCQLPDYTNVSVYMNRNISSAAKDEPLHLFDASSGYIRSTSDVIRLACTQQVCASGRVGVGVTLSNLKYPGHESSEKQIQRFLDSNDEANNFSGLADLYDEGLRWNTHVYCVPQETELSTVVNCSGF